MFGTDDLSKVNKLSKEYWMACGFVNAIEEHEKNKIAQAIVKAFMKEK